MFQQHNNPWPYAMDNIPLLPALGMMRTRTARTIGHEGDKNNKDDNDQVKQVQDKDQMMVVMMGEHRDDDRPPLPQLPQQHPHPLPQATAHSAEQGATGQ
jgi:hypothetical protein